MTYFGVTIIGEAACASPGTSVGVSAEFLPEVGRVGLVDLWMMHSDQNQTTLRLAGISPNELRSIARHLQDAAAWIETQPFAPSLTLVEYSP